ncbi:MAG: ribulose-phosphate 3-epimerase [Dehalococcoidia bacterium]|nr:ribulose-phosphate 3-epimerase [Dehalococcoidia bacterium]
MLIAPSILTADFGRLEEQARAAEAAGADLWHLDVMDGHFVPAITFGASVVEVFRRASSLPIEVHLMVANPEAQLAPFAEAGAERLIFHYEATSTPRALLEATRALGCQRGIAISPDTPVDALTPLLADLEQVTVMLIQPGKGGQPMMPALLEKVRDLRARVDAAGLPTRIEVDGGVKAHNLATCAAAGTHIAVAGSAVFNPAQSPAEAITELRAALARG